MASNAAREFFAARARAGLLVAAATCPAPSSDAVEHKAACLHAALAQMVAAWEAYLERLVREVQAKLTDPSQVRLAAVHALLSNLTEAELKRFNTPNADNSRTLLLTYTGYDCINDWHWPVGGLNAMQTRNRVNEILRVRHGFAHGFALPSGLTWARDRSGNTRLSVASLSDVGRLFAHLVRVTDREMASHLTTVFGVRKPW